MSTPVPATPSFTVEDFFIIRGRGPVITRSVEPARVARDRGERWEPGHEAHCGDLVARVTGIETQGYGNLQQGVLLDIDPSLLSAGQVWVANAIAEDG